MRNWQTRHLVNGSYAIENSRGRRLLEGLPLEVLTSLVDEHNTDIGQASRDMLPVSNDGNYVFIDGPGDVEIDHGGTMRSALEAISTGQGEHAGIAITALEKMGARNRPATTDATHEASL